MYLHKVFVLTFLLEGWYGGSSKVNLYHGLPIIRKDELFLYFMVTLLFTFSMHSKIHLTDCQAPFLIFFNVILVKALVFPILGVGHFKRKLLLFWQCSH
jgi:hypothetical protein